MLQRALRHTFLPLLDTSSSGIVDIITSAYKRDKLIMVRPSLLEGSKLLTALLLQWVSINKELYILAAACP